MIFAETDRLLLRTLENKELPRLVELIGVWDVVRWLSVVPFPYTLTHAEEFYKDMAHSYKTSEPEFFVIALKPDNCLVGGVGLHPPRGKKYTQGEIEIGYWAGKEFWGKGLTTEAARAACALAFTRPSTKSVGASTAPNNHASQSVLSKIGLRNLGLFPRDYSALRGENHIFKWLLTRDEFERRPLP